MSFESVVLQISLRSSAGEDCGFVLLFCLTGDYTVTAVMSTYPSLYYVQVCTVCT